MSYQPSIDYSCAHCGHTQTYRLVPGEAEAPSRSAGIAPAKIPSIDFRCLRCDASQTYRLVPVAVTADAK